MQKINSLRPQIFCETASAERQTNGSMFVCLCVELIPSSDKPRSSSFFIKSPTSWLIGLQSNETPLGRLAVWERSDLCSTVDGVSPHSVFSSDTIILRELLCGISCTEGEMCPHLQLLPGSRPRGANWQVNHQRGATLGRGHGDRSSWSSSSNHWPPTQTLPHPPTHWLLYICVFHKYRAGLQGHKWEINGY